MGRIVTTAYCEVCGWTCVAFDDRSREKLNRAMIDHHVETGHAPIETTAGGPARARDGTDDA